MGFIPLLLQIPFQIPSKKNILRINWKVEGKLPIVFTHQTCRRRSDI